MDFGRSKIIGTKNHRIHIKAYSMVQIIIFRHVSTFGLVSTWVMEKVNFNH